MTLFVDAVIEPLTSLSIDRRRLTLMVVGAGFGESVLIALPGTESWIVIDGAAPESEPPVVRLLERHWTSGGSIELLLLTHPHADHYAGFTKILDHQELGPTVKRIGCVSQYLGVAHGNTLGREVEAAFEAVDVDDPEALRRLGSARAVLERIGYEWLRRPDRRWAAVRGARLDLGDDLLLRVLGPDPRHVATFFTAPNLARRIIGQANDLSVVLDLSFGATRVLLGGDLPNERNGHLVSGGWSHLCATASAMNGHTGYKVAHHASREAIHSDVVASSGRSRSWAATPYNRGQKLPRFEEGEGLSLLQAHEPELMLTALPVNVRGQAPLPERVRRADLQPATMVPSRPIGQLGPTVVAGPVVRSPPTECVWAVQFDDEGHTLAKYRGNAATMIV